jgi:limonene-1,2-epoxide hydrolase
MKDPGQLEPRAVVESFWAAMRSNDWDAAGAVLADGAVVDYICSGERFNRKRWVELQGAYPAAGRWTFDLHRMVVDGNSVVSEVTVSDGEVNARVVVFSEILAGRIARQVEYWPTAYEPPGWRAGLAERIEPVP